MPPTSSSSSDPSSARGRTSASARTDLSASSTRSSTSTTSRLSTSSSNTARSSSSVSTASSSRTSDSTAFTTSTTSTASSSESHTAPSSSHTSSHTSFMSTTASSYRTVATSSSLGTTSDSRSPDASPSSTRSNNDTSPRTASSSRSFSVSLSGSDPSSSDPASHASTTSSPLTSSTDPTFSFTTTHPILQPSSPSITSVSAFTVHSSDSSTSWTTYSSPTSTSHSTSDQMTWSTIVETIVLTSTYTGQDWTSVTQWTSVVVTGTLIPEQSGDPHNDALAHSPGALAGVILGSMAFVSMLALMLVLAYRRHRLHRTEAEAAALNGTRGRRPSMILADDDYDDSPGVNSMSPFSPHGPGGMMQFGPPVALLAGMGAGPAAYNRLRGGESGAEMNLDPSGHEMLDGSGMIARRLTTSELADLALGPTSMADVVLTRDSGSGSGSGSGLAYARASAGSSSMGLISGYGGSNEAEGSADEMGMGIGSRADSGEGDMNAPLIQYTNSPDASTDLHTLYGAVDPTPLARVARPPRSPTRSRTSSSGPEPAAWLSGRDTEYGTIPVMSSSVLASMPALSNSHYSGVGIASPTRMSAALVNNSDPGDPFRDPPSFYSFDEAMQGPQMGGSGSDEIIHAPGGGVTGYSSSSSHGHGVTGLGVAGISSGSSHGDGGHEPGSSSGHGQDGVSSSGHGLYGEGRRSPGPSSLLPTQTAVPPVLRPRGGDEGDDGVDDSSDIDSRGRSKRRRQSFFGLGKPLPWKRESTSSSASDAMSAGMRSSYARTSDSTQMSTHQVSPVASFYGPARFAMANSNKAVATASTMADTLRFAQGQGPPGMAANAYTIHGRPPSMIRPHSPTMPPGSLTSPAFPFLSQVYAPHAMNGLPTVMLSDAASSSEAQHRLNASVPGWQGLRGMFGTPDMPSPAPTEVSSHNAPEGLLDPRLGQLGVVGMQSQGALSFRDDVDYSRPIGALVHNRQYSQTTFRTGDTRSVDVPGDDDDDDVSVFQEAIS
ncbi:uncharacterized protein FIBRA_08230 [Fibroporia radiculosa]|uniref:Uncharacterized protein n=1 Tax=Fibroporia radiculosa TaxID=599839 RepID=J4H523_9APHY|nr:uncharacterized protein FIBRA_08230 [Fibroporia radiculosa]CCM05989.1 predicted protein [Fibroporia radiculosa]